MGNGSGIDKLFDMADGMMDKIEKGLPDDYEKESGLDHLDESPDATIQPSDLGWAPVGKPERWHCFVTPTRWSGTMCGESIDSTIIGPRHMALGSKGYIAACRGCIQAIHDVMANLHRGSR